MKITAAETVAESHGIPFYPEFPGPKNIQMYNKYVIFAFRIKAFINQFLNNKNHEDS